MLAVFDFEEVPTTDMLEAFMDFLNYGLMGSGVEYTLYETDGAKVALLLSDFGLIVNHSNFDTLGWGLDSFDKFMGSTNNVKLNHLRLSDLKDDEWKEDPSDPPDPWDPPNPYADVPEPSTWVMILLGAGMIFRKRILALRRKVK